MNRYVSLEAEKRDTTNAWTLFFFSTIFRQKRDREKRRANWFQLTLHAHGLHLRWYLQGLIVNNFVVCVVIVHEKSELLFVSAIVYSRRTKKRDRPYRTSDDLKLASSHSFHFPHTPKEILAKAFYLNFVRQRQELDHQSRFHMPVNVAMQRPQARVVVHEADDRVSERGHCGRVSTERIRQLQLGLARNVAAVAPAQDEEDVTVLRNEISRQQ